MGSISLPAPILASPTPARPSPPKLAIAHPKHPRTPRTSPSPSPSPSANSPVTLDSAIPYSADPSSAGSEGWAREMELLHELGRSVRGNLRLRPVRSFGGLREAEGVEGAGTDGTGLMSPGRHIAPEGQGGVPVPVPSAAQRAAAPPPALPSLQAHLQGETTPHRSAQHVSSPAPAKGSAHPTTITAAGGGGGAGGGAAAAAGAPLGTRVNGGSSASPSPPPSPSPSGPVSHPTSTIPSAPPAAELLLPQASHPHPPPLQPPPLPARRKAHPHPHPHPHAHHPLQQGAVSPFAASVSSSSSSSSTLTPSSSTPSTSSLLPHHTPPPPLFPSPPPPSAYRPPPAPSSSSAPPPPSTSTSTSTSTSSMRPMPSPPSTGGLSPAPPPGARRSAPALPAAPGTPPTAALRSAGSISSSGSSSTPAPSSGPQPLSASALLAHLPLSPSPSPQPLILDTRPLPSFLAHRLRQSINLAIPSLILKRYAKQGAALGWSLDALRGYVTTEGGREAWDALLASGAEGEPARPGSASGSASGAATWDGTIVIYDEEMDESTRASVRALSQAWTLGTVLCSLVGAERVHYLLGGFAALRAAPGAAGLLVAGEAYLEPHLQQHQQAYQGGSPMLSGQDLTVRSAGLTAPGTGRSSLPSAAGSAGLFSLRTDVASARRRFALELDAEPGTALSGQSGSGSASTGAGSGTGSGTGTASSASSSQQQPALHSPAPVAIGGLRPLGLPRIVDASPSPPPSAACFPRTPRRLGTVSGTGTGEVPVLSLGLMNPGSRSPLPPKLQLRTAPIRSNTAPVPPSPGLLRITPPSPGLLRPKSPALLSPLPLSPVSRAPASPRPPPSPIALRPHTAPFDYPPRPPSTPGLQNSQSQSQGLPATPTSSSAPQPFVISEILPGFLYLGPEPSTDDEVQQLVDRGVKRILNMAEECEDDQGLGLRRKFEMYERVPMRDTVNEENIGRGVRAACLFLDDARLHDSPTYVHCKAGKSRSVTVVMGYLIHAHSWPLSKAYAYVMEKRQGISPNIGFVSELMKFEESQLGTKSVGVGEEGHGHHHAARNAKPAGLGLRRLARGGGARESLPPLSRGASVEDVLVLSGARDEHHLPEEARERTPVSSSLGDAATEKEVKDSDGRYVHARKVPVDRRTLQPQRRVSKAGLESAWIASARPTA